MIGNEICQRCKFWTKTGEKDSGLDWNGYISSNPENNWHYAIGICSHPKSVHQGDDVPNWGSCEFFKRRLATHSKETAKEGNEV